MYAQDLDGKLRVEAVQYFELPMALDKSETSSLLGDVTGGPPMKCPYIVHRNLRYLYNEEDEKYILLRLLSWCQWTSTNSPCPYTGGLIVAIRVLASMKCLQALAQICTMKGMVGSNTQSVLGVAGIRMWYAFVRWLLQACSCLK